MKYIFFILFLTFRVFAVNQIVKYEPEVVELSGVLELRTYPGPPNYENVTLGDDPEKHFYLKLSEPIDVFPVPDLKSLINDVIERDVKILQLSLDKESLSPELRKIGLGKSVKLKGTLFHRFSGHHHSDVVMLVKNIVQK